MADDKALTRHLSKQVATSPMDIQRGQLALVDERGVAWGRARFKRRVGALTATMLAGVIGGGICALSGAWLLGGVLYAAGLAPILYGKYRGLRELLEIELLVRQGQIDEGERRLIAARRLERRNPAGYGRLAGSIASHRGNHEEALRLWARALPRTKGILRSALELGMVNAYARSGNVAEARRRLVLVQFPDEADKIITGQIMSALVVGLHSQADADLPPAETLHDWASMSLRYSHTAIELLALGWAFERRGDADMAMFLAREAMDREYYAYLRSWWPELQDWYDAHKPSEADASPDRAKSTD